MDLQDRFQQNNGPQVFHLRRELINHAQNHQSVSVYFTKLKALWEEMSNFRPLCSCGNCTCGGVKDLVAYFQTEYVMSFVMGLNDSFLKFVDESLFLIPFLPSTNYFSLSPKRRDKETSAYIHLNKD